MNKKQRIALFILAIHFHPMIIASNHSVSNQVDIEIENLRCCGFGECERPTALACPFLVLSMITCYPCIESCVLHNCYKPYRFNQIQRENLARDRMNNIPPVTAQPIK